MKRTAIAIAVGALSIELSPALLAQDDETRLSDQQQMTQEDDQLEQDSEGQGTEVRVEGEPADVNVEQEPAEIQVEQQAPKVTIEQPDPNVTVEQADPNVTVEQTGEANVEVDRAQGAEAEMRDPGAQDQAQQDSDRSSQDRAAGSNDLANRKVSDLEGYTVYSQEDDEEVGDVERVVRDLQNNDTYVVITKGGFLGFGKDEMGYKLDDLEVRNDDKLVIRSSNDGVPGDYSSDQYEDLDSN